MRKIRILSLINDLQFGGDQTRLLAFARTIDRERFELLVVTINKPDPVTDKMLGCMRQQFSDAGIEVLTLDEVHHKTNYRSGRPGDILSLVRVTARLVRKVVRLIRSREVDVVDGHLLIGNFIGIAAGMITRVPVSITVYETARGEAPGVSMYLVKLLLLIMADVVISDSFTRKNEIRATTWPKPTVRVIPSPVFPPQCTRSREDMRKELGISGNALVIGQISRLKRYKGQDHLLSAAVQIVKEYPDVVFLMVGYGDIDYKEYLCERVSSLGLDKNVRLLGYPGYIGDIWNVIDIHVHPSRYDSLPNTIIEGMSLGKPAVVTSVGDIPILVQDKVTGLVVPDGDSQALADALLLLLRTPSLAMRFGAAARQLYCDRYQPTILTHQLEELFHAIVESSLDKQTKTGLNPGASKEA